MSRIVIPVTAMEFEEGGNTIWFHSPFGGTTFRIKTMGKIVMERCSVSPLSHGDLVVDQDINMCVSEDA